MRCRVAGENIFEGDDRVGCVTPRQNLTSQISNVGKSREAVAAKLR
jgi:hypothetical protein